MAAIMVGDIVGYSAMMEKSEEKTVARLATCQALISEKVASLDGRIFNRAGDATLAEFPSPINALRCAVEIGVTLAGADGSDVEPLKMRFGVHLADVAVARRRSGWRWRQSGRAHPAGRCARRRLGERSAVRPYSPQLAIHFRRSRRAPLQELVRANARLSSSRRNRRAQASIRADQIFK